MCGWGHDGIHIVNYVLANIVCGIAVQQLVMLTTGEVKLCCQEIYRQDMFCQS